MAQSLAILVGALGIVSLVRIPRRIMPRHYFELYEIIHGMNNTLTWGAVTIRFGIPVVAGLILGLAIRETQQFVAAGAGFLGAGLLIWPTILNPESLPPTIRRRETALYLVYGMFILSYTTLGLAGGQIAVFLEEPLRRLIDGELGEIGKAASSRIDDVVVGLVVLAIGGLGAWAFRGLYGHVQRDSRG
jgi:hypothetical protein